MAVDNRLQVFDEQGNLVDYDILANDVKFLPDGKDLPTKLAEMEEEIGEGGYTPPAGGIPKTDLAPSVQTSLGKADTALQSETDPTVPAWAKQPTKPTYTAQEVGALPADTVIPEGTTPDTSMSDTSENAVQNKVIKAYVDAAVAAVQTALNALIGGNVQGAIDTFNEVTAFLNGIDTSDPTLKNQLLALNTTIANLQTTLAGKANAADLATVATSGSYNDLSNKPTILSQQQVAGMIEDAIEDLPTGDIPTKVSDLENDEGYIKAEEVGEIVATTGDIAIVETSDYVDIMIYSPEVTITPEVVALHASQKSATIKVSGSHLKADINISVPQGFTATPSTIQQVGGVVAETNVVIAYTGADASTASGTITATSGDTTKSIPLTYTQYAGPTIIADDAAIAFKAGAGSTQQKTLVVQGVNLEAGITAAISGTNAGKFSVSPASISQSGGVASGTLTITYSPAAGDSGTHTATLTLSSSGATSNVITLNGAVSTISVSKQTMTFSTDQGVAVTDTFTVEGANLNEDITIAASGTGFSVSPQTIAQSNGSVASTTVTVTYSPSTAGTHTGSISIQSSGVTKTITLSGTAAAATTSDENGRFYKDIDGKRLYFQRNKNSNDEFTNTVAVYNADYNTGAAASTKYSEAITIPASVACDGTTYNVTRIAGYAFGGCTGLTSLTLPEGLTTIDVNAIRDCTNNSFTSIVIPDSVTSVGQNNLYGCSKLKSVVFGEGLTSIWKYCTDLSSSMTNVVFGSNISSVGANTSFKMSDSGVVTIKRTTPPSPVGVFFMDSAGSYPCGATLKVPASAVETYKTALYYGNDMNGQTKRWKMFDPDNIVAIDE